MKHIIILGTLALAMTATSCGDDENNVVPQSIVVDNNVLEYDAVNKQYLVDLYPYYQEGR